MTDVKRLLDEASPLPWGVESPQKERATLAYIIRERETGPQVANALLAEDAELIAYAVNRLPDHEALRKAAEITSRYWGYSAPHYVTDMRAALDRLRGLERSNLVR